VCSNVLVGKLGSPSFLLRQAIFFAKLPSSRSLGGFSLFRLYFGKLWLSIGAALVLTSLLAPTLAAVSEEGQQRKPIRIGFIASFSGPFSESSKMMINGLRLYLDEVHNTIAGRPVEVLVENDAGSPHEGRLKLKKLIETNKCHIIDGLVIAHLGYAVARVSAKYKVPIVFAHATADDVTQRLHSDWIVRTSTSSSLSTHPLGDWAYKHLGYRRITCLCLDAPYGYEMAGGFQKSFEDAGGKIVAKIWVPLGKTDYRSYIADISETSDAIFLVAPSSQAKALITPVRERFPKMPILGSGNILDESVLSVLGEQALGALSAQVYCNSLATKQNRAFVRAYREKYGVIPGFHAECGYTSGMWIDKAIESVHGNVEDSTGLMAALKRVELQNAPRGPIKLDNHGNPIENVYLRQVQKVGNEYHNAVIHTFPAVSQFWTYDQRTFLKQPVYSKTYPPCTHCSGEN